jgi:hypothetical protein
MIKYNLGKIRVLLETPGQAGYEGLGYFVGSAGGLGPRYAAKIQYAVEHTNQSDPLDVITEWVDVPVVIKD